MFVSRIKNKERKSKKLTYLIVFVLLIAGTCFYFYSKYKYAISSAVNPGDLTDISFIVKKGDVLSVIGKKLAEKNLIVDETAFEWYNRFNKSDRSVVAGRFMLNKSMTIPEIVAKISDKNKGEVTLSVPEGLTIEDIDKKLVSLELIESGEFVQKTKDFKNFKDYPFLDEKKIKALPYPLEGYLFPDTYFLSPNNFNCEDLIDLMLKNFQKRIAVNLKSEISSNSKSLFDIITMASILEEEVNTDKDRPIISGILWKRLDQNWQLGADATLLYLKKERDIDFEDLKDSSPYNTRKFTGLPPGPISNPSLKSIKAALAPEDSPYFFYLNRADNGEVVYAETNDQHNLNRQKYL